MQEQTEVLTPRALIISFRDFRIEVRNYPVGASLLLAIGVGIGIGLSATLYYMICSDK